MWDEGAFQAGRSTVSHGGGSCSQRPGGAGQRPQETLHTQQTSDGCVVLEAGAGRPASAWEPAVGAGAPRLLWGLLPLPLLRGSVLTSVRPGAGWGVEAEHPAHSKREHQGAGAPGWA